MGALLKVAQQNRMRVRTSAAVVAQVWRSGRQANLARVLAGVVAGPLDPEGGRRIGELLAGSATEDVVDAHVALLADPATTILTSGPADIRRLLQVRGVDARVVSI